MKATKTISGAICALTFWTGYPSSAQSAPSCSEEVSRATVVRCALEASLGAKAERIGLAALDGRHQSASVLLPSNPTLSVTGGLPADPSATEQTPLWSATLSQELEIAGQRGARLGAVAAEQRAQQSKVMTAQRQAAADALSAYFEALASTEQLRVADRMMILGKALQDVARARVEVGVGSSIDATLAEAAALRMGHARIEAEQRAASAMATLVALLGMNPLLARPKIDGPLTPLAGPDAPAAILVETAIARRADLAVLAAEREAQAQRIKLFERLRIPNPTLSVFARRDWIGERSVGLGISLPIPLPSPVGRTYSGDIAEASALTQRAETQIERLQRAIRLEVANAIALVAARKRQVELYTPDQLRKSGAMLDAIAEELQAKRIPVRDALLTQQGLIEILSGHVQAQKALCLASVDLARVTGVELERGVQ
jgi:cobalt-zinc-cadmium efflux system outer membrane protein